jgi:anaerobic magnesium-protoporphyrin IX monomethyl ester cyclase
MFLFINLCQINQHTNIMNNLRSRMPPFGVAGLASWLRTLGVDSMLHDDNLLEFSDEQLRMLFRKHKGDLQAIGLTSISTTLSQLKRVSRLAKEELPAVPLLVGGPHARLLPEDLIALPTVDVVFTGEADLPICDYAKGVPLDALRGIWYKDGDKIIRNHPGDYVKDLDTVPFPAYDLFHIADYHGTKGIAKRSPASYVITSRGCPYDCTFCSSKALNPSETKSVRYRSPENVVSEIEYIKKDHGIREILFSDDMFTGRESHLFGICELLIKKKLDLIWACQTHVKNISEEKLRIMKRAGCHQICFGVESGDAAIQKATRKNLDPKQVHQVVRLTQSIGIDARCSFMFGNQFETPETLQRTIDLAIWLAPDFASFNIATPFPGTHLRTWAMDNGCLADPSYEALDSTSYTLVTRDLPPGTVEKYCQKAFRRFYFSPRYLFRRMRRIRDLEGLVRVVKSAFYAARLIPMLFGQNTPKRIHAGETGPILHGRTGQER